MAKARASRKQPRKTRATIQLVRVARLPARKARSRTGTEAAAATPADAVPVATIASAAGPVTVAIAFGHAQHGQYTIQVFDPAGTIELTRQTGLNTDSIPDEFMLQGTSAQLNQHLLQWTGAVSAFGPAPGQQFSITLDVTQNGVAVPGGRVQRNGPLNITQAFLGVLRLVTQ